MNTLTIPPSRWQPRTFADLIGPAAKVGRVLCAKADRLLADKDACLKVMIYGTPGCGKSTLARLLAAKIAGDSLAIEKSSGLDVTIDKVREWEHNAAMGGLFGNIQCKVVEEMDRVPTAAQDRMLEYLDKLPAQRAFIGTSNLQLDLLQERFQTRVQAWKVEGPDTEDIMALVMRWGIDRTTAGQIAVASGGNVRAALLDTESALDVALAA